MELNPQTSIDSMRPGMTNPEKDEEKIQNQPFDDAATDTASAKLPTDLEMGQPPVSRSDILLDWDGPADSDNPLNWPKAKRLYHLIPAALISFSATLGSSIYTPAYPQIMERFGVSSTAALLPLSLYVLALGLGPILGAPLSETYGRRPVYQLSPIFGILFTIGAGFAPNFASLAIMRFFAGTFFSPALAIGAGTIADICMPAERALATTLYILSPFLGPSFGPVIGSFVTVRKDWQWTQWTLIFFALLAWISVFPMSETYKKTVLQKRRARLGLPPVRPRSQSTWRALRYLLTVTLTRPLHMLFTEPIVAFLSLYIAFNFGVLFTFFACFPYVFSTVYGFDIEQSGLVFLALGIGCVLAVPSTIACDHYIYQKKNELSKKAGKNGRVAPEHRLYPAMMGSFGLPIGLFWFAWTARSDIPWASPVVAAIPFAWGNLSIFIASGMYLVDTYQAMNGASAIAANGLLRYFFGFGFPLFTLQMYNALGIAWSTSLLGFVTVTLMPIPWVLFKYGHKIRTNSSYPTIEA